MRDDLDADVVIFLVNAEQAMKIIATLNRGAPLNFKVSSSMALCRDATAIPILTGKPNISLLCGGARMYGRFDKNIFALGVPIGLCEIFFKKDLDLTPTEKYILYILENKGRGMSAKELTYDSGLPDRTVRNSLQSLLKNGLIEKSTDLRDARTAIYGVKR
jgi:DNA-binding transcriptional ArsR family regulator